MAARQEAHAVQDGSDRASFGRACRPVEWPRIANKNGLLFRRRSMNGWVFAGLLGRAQSRRLKLLIGLGGGFGFAYSPTYIGSCRSAERRDVSSRKPSANAATSPGALRFVWTASYAWS